MTDPFPGPGPPEGEPSPAPGQPEDGAVARMLRDRPSTGVKWGLERTRAVLSALGDPQESFEAYHVGGTNGKGSVSVLTGALLEAAGLRTGLYLSPHMIRFAERVRVPPDRRPASPELLEECAERVAPLADRAGASRFEAITALGFLALAEVGVEAACVEVGLGGRLDATSVLLPRAAAVVTVALDHGEFLGGTLAEVAREKAGILKPGVPAAVGRVPPEAAAVLEERARQVGAPLLRLGREAAVEDVRVEAAPAGATRFRYLSARRPEGLSLRVPLAGRHQADNAALSLLLLEAAGREVGDDEARGALAGVRHPGRLQLVQREGLWILDVAHNPAAVEAVLGAVRELRAPAPRVGVVSVLRDKAWREMVRRLADELEAVVCTIPPTADPARRWRIEEVEAALEGRVECVGQLDDALRRGRELAGDGTVLVTGTTALVGDALQRLEAERSDVE